MIKKFTLVIFTCLMGMHLSAQLPNGSIAPDFTLMDLDSNTWTLYEILNQGKKVIIDFSATWCVPCWNYHNTKSMANLYNEHGPEGTDEYMVFYIEGDGNTNTACLYGPTGCNSVTQGNWVQGTPYPIIESHELAQAYNISFFPTIYHICPNRIITLVGQVSADALYAAGNNCQGAFGANNGGLLRYTAQQGRFCKSIDAVPAALLQNLGEDTIYTAVFELFVNDEWHDSMVWEGALGTFELQEIQFSPVSLEGDAELEIKIKSINGVEDEAPENDQVVASYVRSDEVDHNILTLELRTDQYAVETYWELLNEDGVAIYSGGNPGIFSQDILPGAYAGNTTYTHQLAVPVDGCYELIVYDAFGDGICCEFGNGFYRLKDEEGNILFAGGQFADEEVQPFGLVDAGEVIDNAQIVSYTGLSGEVCGDAIWQPSIQVQNIGVNPIERILFELLKNGEIINTHEYTGNINPLAYRAIHMEGMDIEDGGTLVVQIAEVNGQEHIYSYKNSHSASVQIVNKTEKDTLIVEIRTDRWGYETYWEIQDDSGNTIAFGGNTRVGIDGGGAQIAEAGDPGAYPNSTLIREDVVVDADGCYTLIMVDDYGDGFESPGIYRLREKATNSIIFTGAAGFGARADKGFEVELVISNTKEIPSIHQITLAPNPMNGLAILNLELSAPEQLEISIYNSMGQLISSLGRIRFDSGQHDLPIHLQNQPNGMYHLVIKNEASVVNKPFVLTK